MTSCSDVLRLCSAQAPRLLRDPMVIDLGSRLPATSCGGEVGGSEPIRIPTTQILLASPGVYRVHLITEGLPPEGRFTSSCFRRNTASLWHWSSLPCINRVVEEDGRYPSGVPLMLGRSSLGVVSAEPKGEAGRSRGDHLKERILSIA